MDAQLSQRAAKIFQSPYFEVMEIDTSALTQRMVKASTFDNLSTEDKELIELGEKSLFIAQQLNFYPPYNTSDLGKIIAKLEEETGKPILSARDEEIDIDFGV